MDIILIDNCLPDEHLKKIQSTMLGEDFPWFYRSYKVSPETANSLNDFQFNHNFYNDFSFKSPYTEILIPIFEILNPSALVRIKANLTTMTDEIVQYDYHVDYENFDGKTAIFYVNSNNGYTLFDDGSKVKSIENRLVIFDSKIKHTGTSCTDQKVRCVINFNYYTWSD